MRKDELYGKILDISKATFYKYVKKRVPVINLLNQFTMEELEEFASTGQILSLKHYRHWKNSTANKVSLINKLAKVIDAGDLENFEYLNFLALVFISFRQGRILGQLPAGLHEFVHSLEEVDFSTLYNFFILSTSKEDLFESLHNHQTPHMIMLQKLNVLNTITLDESEHLSYLIESYLEELVEIAGKRDDVSIDEMKSLVMLSLIIQTADWYQDLEMKEIIDVALPKSSFEILIKTKSKSKLIGLYEKQRRPLNLKLKELFGGIPFGPNKTYTKGAKEILIDVLKKISPKDTFFTIDNAKEILLDRISGEELKWLAIKNPAKRDLLSNYIKENFSNAEILAMVQRNNEIIEFLKKI